MGAQSFMIEKEAANVQDGWNRIIAEANYYDGHDSYNGSPNTCDLGRITFRSGEKYSKTSEKKAMKFIEKEDYGSKWIANAVDMGVSKYVLRSVKKYPASSSQRPAKYEWRFIVESYDGNGRIKEISAEKTRADAEKEARHYVLKTGFQSTIRKTKCMVSGSESLGTFGVEEKTYKTKPHPKNMEGKVLIEMHRYLYYGWASC